MKNLFKIICISLLFFSLSVNSQTVTALQMQNARATGYAIVAAKNPGKSFSVFIVKWDGIHDLEYNANNQINPGWHPQAAIKGNYFDQPFVNNDFTVYSSVVVSQAEFDTYKSAGTDWWIICSTLPSFSNTGLVISDNGNVGIGTKDPTSKLEVYNTAQSGHLLLTANDNPNADQTRIDIDFRVANQGHTVGRIASSYDTSANGGSGGLRFYTRNQGDLIENVRINYLGNVGIGTTTPDSKLTVNGNVHAKEVKIDLSIPAPDYVFAPAYKLKTLEEVEEYIKKNNHLPEIPSAKEFEKNGLLLAEMNMSLLKKMEEMTLYMIEQNKRIDSQSKTLEIQDKEIKTLKKQNETFKILSERFSKIESQLKTTKKLS